jgi:nicotinate-nucleotide pyrophosphorylase (carboxylating)
MKLSPVLQGFLDEDCYLHDVTTALVEEKHCTAELVAKEDCVLAGIEEATQIFESRGLKVVFSMRDGQEASAGKVVMRLEGSNKKLLPVERAVLNLLGRMCGIATMSRKARDVTAKYGVEAMATRKTLPGLRDLDKKAVRIGGAEPHRRDLSSMVLLKDNHLKFFPGVGKAVEKARREAKPPIEVEVEGFEQALEALKAGADVIMLDNFGLEETRKTLRALKRYPVKVELSGNITLENLESHARLKPDFISMGCLTHSVQSKDLSLRIV